MVWRRSRLMCDGKCCLTIFGLMFSLSVGYMLGALHSLDLTQEATLVKDKLNHAELELYEAERQLIQCDQELGHKMNAMLVEGSPKTIFVITPTYTRPTQEVELISLSQALMHVPYVHWIIVEFSKTQLVSNLVEEFGIPASHIESGNKRQEGINSCSVLRNTALEYITSNNSLTNGIVIFANTDRTYSAAGFDFIRKIEKIGMWPVGFVPEQFICKPKLKFISDNAVAKDKLIVYPINIASLGIHSELLKKNFHARFLTKGLDTFVTSKFLEQFITSAEQLELPLYSCDKYYVWYTPLQLNIY